MNIVCVLVTFNRIEKLKRALNSYTMQIRKPNRLIVVDNCSTDGTVDYLTQWEALNEGFEKKVIFLSTNTGGAGGFYYGLQEAMKYQSDWIYISDDDAYLEKDVIDRIQYHALKIDDNVGAICGTVKEKNGIGYFHRRVYKEGFFSLKECNLKDEDYKKEYVELSTYSFVGTAIRTDALWNIGLPNKDFFLWYDDTEHGMRMGKRYRIILFPDIVINHDVDSSNTEVNWKKYYGYRNNLLAIKYNYNISYFNHLVILFYFSMFRDLVIPRRRPLIRMKNEAINDAKNNKLGVSKIYYPGAKIR